MPFLKEMRITKSVGLLTFSLKNLSVGTLCTYQKRARFPSSDCHGSLKKLTYSYSEISGPYCSSDKRFVSAYTLEARTMILVHKPGFQFLSSGNLLVTIIPNYTQKDIKINAQKRVTISIKTKHVFYRNP